MSSPVLDSRFNWFWILVAGQKAPQVVVDDTRAAAAEFTALARSVGDTGPQIEALRARVATMLPPDVAEQFSKASRMFSDSMPDMGAGAGQLGESLTELALDVERTNYSIIIQVSTFAASAVLALLTPFTAWLVPGIITGARLVVSQLISRLVTAAMALARLAAPGIARILDAVAKLRWLGRLLAAAAAEAVQEVAQEGLAQGIQIAQGHRAWSNIDGGSLAQAARWGALAGVQIRGVADAVGHLKPKVAGNVVFSAGNQALAETTVGVAAALANGMPLGDVWMGTVSGAATSLAHSGAHSSGRAAAKVAGVNAPAGASMDASQLGGFGSLEKEPGGKTSDLAAGADVPVGAPQDGETVSTTAPVSRASADHATPTTPRAPANPLAEPAAAGDRNPPGSAGPISAGVVEGTGSVVRSATGPSAETGTDVVQATAQPPVVIQPSGHAGGQDSGAGGTPAATTAGSPGSSAGSAQSAGSIPVSSPNSPPAGPLSTSVEAPPNSFASETPRAAVGGPTAGGTDVLSISPSPSSESPGLQVPEPPTSTTLPDAAPGTTGDPGHGGALQPADPSAPLNPYRALAHAAITSGVPLVTSGVDTVEHLEAELRHLVGSAVPGQDELSARQTLRLLADLTGTTLSVTDGSNRPLDHVVPAPRETTTATDRSHLRLSTRPPAATPAERSGQFATAQRELAELEPGLAGDLRDRADGVLGPDRREPVSIGRPTPAAAHWRDIRDAVAARLLRHDTNAAQELADQLWVENPYPTAARLRGGAPGRGAQPGDAGRGRAGRPRLPRLHTELELRLAQVRGSSPASLDEVVSGTSSRSSSTDSRPFELGDDATDSGASSSDQDPAAASRSSSSASLASLALETTTDAHQQHARILLSQNNVDLRAPRSRAVLGELVARSRAGDSSDALAALAHERGRGLPRRTAVSVAAPQPAARTAVVQDTTTDLRGLQAVLSERGLAAVDVNRQAGECFFEALEATAARSGAPLGVTPAELRERVARHLHGHRADYAGFVTAPEALSRIGQLVAQPGSFDSELHDFVPVAAADVLRRRIVVLGRQGEVLQRLGSGTAPPIVVAWVDPGAGHGDATGDAGHYLATVPVQLDATTVRQWQAWAHHPRRQLLAARARVVDLGTAGNAVLDDAVSTSLQEVLGTVPEPGAPAQPVLLDHLPGYVAERPHTHDVAQQPLRAVVRALLLVALAQHDGSAPERLLSQYGQLLVDPLALHAETDAEAAGLWEFTDSLTAADRIRLGLHPPGGTLSDDDFARWEESLRDLTALSEEAMPANIEPDAQAIFWTPPTDPGEAERANLLDRLRRLNDAHAAATVVSGDGGEDGERRAAMVLAAAPLRAATRYAEQLSNPPAADQSSGELTTQLRTAIEAAERRLRRVPGVVVTSAELPDAQGPNDPREGERGPGFGFSPEGAVVPRLSPGQLQRFLADIQDNAEDTAIAALNTQLLSDPVPSGGESGEPGTDEDVEATFARLVRATWELLAGPGTAPGTARAAFSRRMRAALLGHWARDRFGAPDLLVNREGLSMIDYPSMHGQAASLRSWESTFTHDRMVDSGYVPAADDDEDLSEWAATDPFRSRPTLTQHLRRYVRNDPAAFPGSVVLDDGRALGPDESAVRDNLRNAFGAGPRPVTFTTSVDWRGRLLLAGERVPASFLATMMGDEVGVAVSPIRVPDGRYAIAVAQPGDVPHYLLLSAADSPAGGAGGLFTRRVRVARRVRWAADRVEELPRPADGPTTDADDFRATWNHLLQRGVHHDSTVLPPAVVLWDTRRLSAAETALRSNLRNAFGSGPGPLTFTRTVDARGGLTIAGTRLTFAVLATMLGDDVSLAVSANRLPDGRFAVVLARRGGDPHYLALPATAVLGHDGTQHRSEDADAPPRLTQPVDAPGVDPSSRRPTWEQLLRRGVRDEPDALAPNVVLDDTRALGDSERVLRDNLRTAFTAGPRPIVFRATVDARGGVGIAGTRRRFPVLAQMLRDDVVIAVSPIELADGRFAMVLTGRDGVPHYLSLPGDPFDRFD